MSRASTPKENSAASAGESETANAKASTTSAQKARENALSSFANSAPPSSETGIQTVEQALAIAWPGLEWLARHRREVDGLPTLILCNDRKEKMAWIGFKEIRVGEDGFHKWLQPTDEALALKEGKE